MRTLIEWAKWYIVTITNFDASAGAFPSVTDKFMLVGLNTSLTYPAREYWDIRSSNAKKIRLEWDATLT